MAGEFGEGGSGEFGSCCRYLKDILETDDFEPLLYVGDDGILYMSVGVEFVDEDEEEGDEPDFLDHPVYCCPFCGTKLQDPEEVDALTSDD